jgi:predicted nucleic acid-binding protein
MIFVDTGAWIALTDTSDQYHIKARRIYAELKRERPRFLTTEYVVDETITRLRYDADYATALRCLDLLFAAEKAGALQIVYTDEALVAEAMAIFRQYDTAILSVTDCVSFAVCKRGKIHRAFSFDQHFPMMGLSLCT